MTNSSRSSEYVNDRIYFLLAIYVLAKIIRKKQSACTLSKGE